MGSQSKARGTPASVSRSLGSYRLKLYILRTCGGTTVSSARSVLSATSLTGVHGISSFFISVIANIVSFDVSLFHGLCMSRLSYPERRHDNPLSNLLTE